MSGLKKWLSGEQASLPPQWKTWLEYKVHSCRKRAEEYAEKNKIGKRYIPTREKWRDAILKALRECEGVGHYSRFPLSVRLSSNDPRYPSVDHLGTPLNLRVVIETRLVNDMKSILSEKEFIKMITHLYKTSHNKKSDLPLNKKPCKRSYL